MGSSTHAIRLPDGNRLLEPMSCPTKPCSGPATSVASLRFPPAADGQRYAACVGWQIGSPTFEGHRCWVVGPKRRNAWHFLGLFHCVQWYQEVYDD